MLPASISITLSIFVREFFWVLYHSENRQRLNSAKQLVFVMEMLCVLFAVLTKFSDPLLYLRVTAK
jgi:hypothetical protein